MAVQVEPSAVEIIVDLGNSPTDDVENLQPVVTLAEQPPKEPSRPKGLPFLSDIKKRGKEQSANSPSGQRATRGLPFITELVTGRQKRKRANTNDDSGSSQTPLDAPHSSTDWDVTPTTMERKQKEVTIKTGVLLKTSCGRSDGAHPGPTRQRRFRLTEQAIEYLQHFSQVKVKRSYPLTAIEELDYLSDTDPLSFKLIFSTYVMTLQSDSEDDARDWVEKIGAAWAQWHIHVPSEDTVERETSSPALFAGDDDSIGPPSPQRAQSPSAGPPPAPSAHHRVRSYTNPVLLRRDSSMSDMETYDSRRHKLNRQAFRIRKAVRLAPKLVKQQKMDPESEAVHTKLHSEYAMIKYPRKLLGIPHEKVFKVDKDNLQILWRSSTGHRFRQKSTLSFHRIVEIREGQQTRKFDKFPYEEVVDQSFSLIFEQEKNKYVRLTSLDLICDHPEHYAEWMEGLRTLVSGPNWYSTYPAQYENTDPTVLWLKQLWTCKSSHHELTEKKAIKVAKKIKPTISDEEARMIIKDAHRHQCRYTLNYKAALRWDGFNLMFNLLCGKNIRLSAIFVQYAKTYPNLGMSVEEFKTFLMEECYWTEEECSTGNIQALIRHHDFHHQAFKKYVAENKPLEFQIGSNLLSYAGFISFLRSKDNPVIDLEHETVYQDMTQPLSHYFINSSHNTYLEGDQLRGRSSTDAYVRALLQGCRCVEIDCWDPGLNTPGENEPIIYHGYTLTTKLPFRDVIHAIKDYSFSNSIYPLIISIENHCSGPNQSRMAKVFRAVMGDVLPTENLVELEGRERLPSPQELQGKIILKGSLKKGHRSPKGTVARGNRFAPDTSIASVDQTPSVNTSLVSLATNVEISLSPPTSPQVQQTDESQNQFKFSYSSRQRRSLRDIERRVKEEEKGQDDQELAFSETAEDLKKLIIYCRSVSIKPWSWRKQKETTVSEMFSFGEPSAIRHCKTSPREVLACTERQLVRTYPKGVRFDSSNYEPLIMWNCGIQLVALNYQYPDTWLHLNQGLFRLNGGCGYVLKPAVMRREDPGGTKGGSAPYNPDMKVPHPDVPVVDLEIELLSGQRLWKKKSASITVDIHTYGIPIDCCKMEPQAGSTKAFWPQWQKDHHKLTKQILMPELCLVYFRVESEGKKLVGQNCIPLISLQSGIKFIPMRTSGGELIPESGIFVRIKKKVGSTWVSNAPRKMSKLDSADDDNILESIDEEPEELDLGDIDVTKSINPIAIRQRSNPTKRFSSPPNLQSSITEFMQSRSPVFSDDDDSIVATGVSVADGSVVVTAKKQRSATKIVESPPTCTSPPVLLSIEPTGSLTANGAGGFNAMTDTVPEKEIFLKVEIHESESSLV